MKFGFDIDDTLINLREYAFHLYNKKLNQNVSMDVFRELKMLEIHEAFGLEKEAGGEMWKSLAEDIYFNECPAFEGALELLHELKDEGHEIYYITSRHGKHCERTRDWMLNQGFPVAEGHFFCGMKDEEKINIIHSLQLDYYFDDKPAVLETLIDTETKVFIIDQSYNQHVKKFPRLKKWSELRESIAK